MLLRQQRCSRTREKHKNGGGGHPIHPFLTYLGVFLHMSKWKANSKS